MEMFNNMGATKQMNERFQQYPSAPYAQEAYNQHYMYEPPPPAQYAPSSPITPKHGHHGGSHKSNAAMSALTLLAFLFFLNILQQCLKEHMTSMSAAPIMIMTGGKEGELPLAKTTEGVKKSDKTGQLQKPVIAKAEHKPKPANIGWVTSTDDKLKDDNFMKISLEHREKPRDGSGFPGFINAMKMD